jgi:hypothetical protein
LPELEEGRIATLIAAQANDLGGGRGGVHLRWTTKPRPGVWIATVAEARKHRFYRATGSTPLRALVATRDDEK